MSRFSVYYYVHTLYKGWKLWNHLIALPLTQRTAILEACQNFQRLIRLRYYSKLLIKVKLSRTKSWRLRRGMEYRDSVLTLTFGTTRTAMLSAVRSGRTLPPRKLLGTEFCYRLSGAQGYWMRTEGLGRLQISEDPTWDRARNLPSCGAVPLATHSFWQLGTTCNYKRHWSVWQLIQLTK